MRSKTFRQNLAALRGMRMLERVGRPYSVLAALNEAQQASLGVGLYDLKKLTKMVDAEVIETRLRQLLLKRHSKIYFLAFVILGSKASKSMPIPIEWAKCFMRQGIKMDSAGCFRLLWIKSMAPVLRGIGVFFSLLLQNRQVRTRGEEYVVFLNLTNANIPTESNSDSRDVISWFKRSKLDRSTCGRIVAEIPGSRSKIHSNGIETVGTIFPRQQDRKLWFKFAYQAGFEILFSLGAVLQGKWWHGVLLCDLIEGLYVSLLPKHYLAKEYFFNNSVWYSKPLWAEIAESKGSRVTCYYYSTNIQPYDFGTGISPPAPGLTIMTWNHFIVWDDCQEAYLRIFRPDARFIQVGHIDFSDDNYSFSRTEGKLTISVFDVSSPRPTMAAAIGVPQNSTYLTQVNCRQFAKDMAWIAAKVPDVEILYKAKRQRQINRTGVGTYRFWNKLFEETKIVPVDPRVGGSRLIEATDIVISMPFTSAAIIGKEKGKNSVYYDPTNKVIAPCSRGIELIGTREALRDWIQEEVRLWRDSKKGRDSGRLC